MKNWKFILACFSALVFSACANIVAPTGGPRDTEAPKMKNRSSVDSLVNFKGGNLILEFDEYIKLNNAQQNFEISPLTKIKPKIRIKKKRLIIELPDSLLESNTTYNLDFGNAVQDIRESNTFKNLNIVLSTGAYFDTLGVDGQIFDAASGTGDSILVMLYPAAMDDSLLLKQKPLYVTKAYNGSFAFRGLPNKLFRIAALDDKNSNYVYDAIGEKIAFDDIIIDPTKSNQEIVLYSFVEQSETDTTIKGPSLRDRKAPKGKFALSLNPNIKAQKKFNIYDSLEIIIGDTNAIVNTDKIRLYEDGVLDLSAEINYINEEDKIVILPEWKMGTSYKLLLQEGLLSLKEEQSQGDTILFESIGIEDYGSIVVQLDTSLYKEGAILILRSKDKDLKMIKASLEPMRFDFLVPEKYHLRLLYDENDNSVWDAGKLSERKQAERTMEMPQIIQLKANMEEIVKWNLTMKKSKMKDK